MRAPGLGTGDVSSSRFPVVMAGAMYSELNAAMAAEARMEAMQLNEHQKRLAEFGLSSKDEIR